jgi:DNA-binding SARP family transcriptional activator
MGRLQINLLGEPRISYEGRLLKFPTRKILALFIYLVVEGGWHRREKLTTLFWPESDPRLAKAALRNTLTRLRRALQVADKPIVSEAGAVGLDPETAHTLDL